MRIRAAVLLVLLARSAWAEDKPAPAAAPTPGPERGPGVTKPPAEMIRENALLLDQARTARDAARGGHCEIVTEISPKLRALDPTFHDQLFVIDPLIAACLDPSAVPRSALRARIVVREVRGEPPASFGRLSGELVLGMVVGAGGALVGALLGGAMCVGGDDGGCDASTAGGAYIGGILTIPFGVHAVGTLGAETGSLRMTYLGSALGGLGGLLMLANGRDDITALGLILAPPIGAMIGFNTSRRYRPQRVRVPALVSWADGEGASLGVPIPTRTRSEERTVTSVPLLGGTF